MEGTDSPALVALNPLATVRCGTAVDERLRRAIHQRRVTQVAQESSRSKWNTQAKVPDCNPRPIRRQDHDSVVAAMELSHCYGDGVRVTGQARQSD
jgi:hypothetical protein